MSATAAQVPQRLINVHTLQLEECSPNSPPGYAILSHTWGQQELSFQTWNPADHGKHLHGYRKIEGACRIASEEFHLNYLWADTCCIDKSSSAELTEAINAMFQYYKNAHTCLVYLEDVPDIHPLESNGDQGDLMMDTLCSSRWFSRGWTLQELIAPSNIHFYNAEWRPLVGLHEAPSVAEALSKRTGVPETVLTGQSQPSEWCLAARMSWASHRTTTRIEDQAYCLLGIFEVSLPLIYGEGRRAFLRLQEEIIRRSTDQSIFAWTQPPGTARRLALFADSPRDFGYAIIDPVIARQPRLSDANIQEQSFEVTNLGLRIKLPLVKCLTFEASHHAVLDCGFEDDDSGLLAVNVLSLHPELQPGDFAATAQPGNEPLILAPDFQQRPDFDCPVSHYNRLALVPKSCITEDMKQNVTIVRDIQEIRSNTLAHLPQRPDPVDHRKCVYTLTLRMAEETEDSARNLPTRTAAYPDNSTFLTRELSRYNRSYRIPMKATIQAISFYGITDNHLNVAFFFLRAGPDQPVLQLGRANVRFAIVDLNGQSFSQAIESLRSELETAPILRSYRRERLYTLPGARLKVMVNPRSSPRTDLMALSVIIERMPREMRLRPGRPRGPVFHHPEILEDELESASSINQSTTSLERLVTSRDADGPFIEEVD